MAKRKLTSGESFDLRQALHLATLDALMASRRWQPGELVFQGGTSLHLAHGSPRFSEDLDFLVNSSLKLEALAVAVQGRLAGTAWLPPGTRLTVTRAKEDRNPHTFVVAVGGANVIGAVRVKVELWRTGAQALGALGVVVAPLRLARGPAAGMQTFVPTADMSEIYADKVFALAARPYLKPRDVFDLYWLNSQDAVGKPSIDDLRIRLATYPNESPAAWLEKAVRRRDELRASTAAMKADLERWLPSTWPLDDARVGRMIDASVEALDGGVALMRAIAAPPSAVPGASRDDPDEDPPTRAKP